MLRSSFIAVVLSIFAAAAAAQCVAQPPATPVATRQGGELIKTAAAATHTGPAVPRAQAPVSQVSDKHDRRTGHAMLFAALALMSGIALRRYTAPKQ